MMGVKVLVFNDGFEGSTWFNEGLNDGFNHGLVMV